MMLDTLVDVSSKLENLIVCSLETFYKFFVSFMQLCNRNSTKHMNDQKHFACETEVIFFPTFAWLLKYATYNTIYHNGKSNIVRQIT